MDEFDVVGGEYEFKIKTVEDKDYGIVERIE